MRRLLSWAGVVLWAALAVAGARGQDSDLLEDVPLRCRSGAEAFVRHMEQGGYYYGAGALREALAEYSCAVLTSEASALPYYSRGRVLLDMAQYAGAIADFSRALELKPDWAAAYNNRAYAQYALGQTEAALADYERALALQPDYALAYNNRGLAYLQAGRFEAALADFERALELDFERPEWAMTNAGIALAAAGAEEEAVYRLLEAINAAPGFAEPHRRLADIYYAQGDYVQALTHYRRYAELVGDGMDAVARARLESLQQRATLLRLLPTFVIVVVVGVALALEAFRRLSAGRRLRAAAALWLVVLSWPSVQAGAQECAQTDAEGYYARAVGLAQAGNPDDALAALDCALLLDGDFTAAYEVRVNLNARLGRWGAVIDDYNALISRDPERAAYYVGRGNAYAALALQRPLYSAQAIADFNQAITLDDAAAAPYIGLGNLMATQERYNEAIIYYEAALVRNPEDPLALRNAAIAYANMGDYASAEARLLAALSFAPQDSAIQELLAELEAIRNAPTPAPQVAIAQPPPATTPPYNPTTANTALQLLAAGLLAALVWRRLRALRIYGGRR